jgi:phage terminase small subunit
MPILTNPKHELFAQELAKGRTATAAYEAAGYKSDRKNAARLTTNDHVRRRVADIQQRGAVRAEISLASLTEMLLADRELARESKQIAAAVSAVEKIGKLHGLFVDRQEVRTSWLSTVGAAERDLIRESINAELARRRSLAQHEASRDER